MFASQAISSAGTYILPISEARVPRVRDRASKKIPELISKKSRIIKAIYDPENISGATESCSRVDVPYLGNIIYIISIYIYIYLYYILFMYYI